MELQTVHISDQAEHSTESSYNSCPGSVLFAQAFQSKVLRSLLYLDNFPVFSSTARRAIAVTPVVRVPVPVPVPVPLC